MAADKMKEILKHFPDLENGWKEMEEKLKAEPEERELLSLKYREMSQRESSKESLVESEFTKVKMADSDLKVMKANELLDKALDFIVETQEQNDYICEQMCEEYVGDYCEKNCQNLNKECVKLFLQKVYDKE